MANAKSELAELLIRLREGDAGAACELHREFGQHIRRIARIWLVGRPLGALMDSEDVCQSVMIEFFQRYSSGRYEIANADQLRGLLGKIAGSRLHYHWRRNRTAKRDLDRQQQSCVSDVEVAHASRSPSSLLLQSEKFDQCREKFTSQEWAVVSLRHNGLSWQAVGEEVGAAADTVRISYARAITRVSLLLRDLPAERET